TTSLPIAQQGIIQVAIPAHEFLPGQPSTFWILTGDPTGASVEASCAAVPSWEDAGRVEFTTDERGAGQLVIPALPDGMVALAFDLTCRDEMGRSAEDVFQFD